MDVAVPLDGRHDVVGGRRAVFVAHVGLADNWRPVDDEVVELGVFQLALQVVLGRELVERPPTSVDEPFDPSAELRQCPIGEPVVRRTEPVARSAGHQVSAPYTAAAIASTVSAP